MFFTFNKIAITSLCCIVLNLKSVNGEEVKEKLKVVCDISSERFPTNCQEISDILDTYSACLEILQTYLRLDKDKLYCELLSRLDCIREDIKQLFYAGNILYEDVKSVNDVVGDIHAEYSNQLQERWHGERYDCGSEVMAKSKETPIIPLALWGTVKEKRKSCEIIFNQVKGKLHE